MNNSANEKPMSLKHSPEARPKFSILHTSARPDKWKEVYDAWLATADHPEDVEYVLVVDARWGFNPIEHDAKDKTLSWNLEGKFQKGRTQDKLIWNTGRRCYVEGVNLAAQHATGEILIVNADDQFPCEHWDSEIKRKMCILGDERDAGPFLLAANTGTPRERERGIVVMPIMSDVLYRRWGYVFYPGYESMFADNDLFEHAKAEGVLVNWDSPVFPHKHPMFDGSGKWRTTRAELDAAGFDQAYEQQNRPEAYTIGEMLLKARRANGFKQLSQKPVSIDSKRKTVAVCLPGETFSSYFVVHWTALHKMLIEEYNLIDPYFGQSSDAAATRTALRNDVVNGPKPDYVLWIDDDNLLSPDSLRIMLRDLESEPRYAGVVGWCHIDSKRISCGLMQESGIPGGIPLEIFFDTAQYPSPLWRVEWSGFPAVLMRYEVLEKLGPRGFNRIPNEFAPYFEYGEDVSFFLRAKEQGFLFVVDRRVKVPHLKTRDINPESPGATREAAYTAA